MENSPSTIEQFNSKIYLRNRNGKKALYSETIKGNHKKDNDLLDMIQSVISKVNEGLDLTEDEEKWLNKIYESINRLEERCFIKK
ncbi:hypothetical protein [Oceanobacillus massiliensis]|uniref:hypothetical protein n=1 Tax=Oceanobacillus massiliensis TaxID=1465765 RepID=UPI00301A0C67